MSAHLNHTTIDWYKGRKLAAEVHSAAEPQGGEF